MTEKQIEKARKIRYKKPLVKEISYNFIIEKLWEINDDCEEVGIYCKDDFDDLADVMGEDDAEEFAMQFSLLSGDAYALQNDIQEQYVDDCFDIFFVAVGGRNFGGGLMGYDDFEGDYFGLATVVLKICIRYPVPSICLWQQISGFLQIKT